MSIKYKIMEDKIFLLVKCTVKTSHRIIHDAITELQNGTQLQVTSTQNVQVLKAEIIKMQTQEKKG